MVYGKHFKIAGHDKTKNSEYHLRFPKKVVLTIINKYYAHDRSKHINETSFNNYAKNSSRYRGTIAVRYEGMDKPVNSICFDITDLSDFAGFIDLESGNTL